MTNIRVLAEYGDLCGEGPLWDFRTGQLYWTDMLGKRIYCYDWGTQSHRIAKEGFEVCGFTFDAAGCFVVANSTGFWSSVGEGSPHLITREAGGHTCQLNDCIADPAGRVLAGSQFYDPARDYPLGCLISLDGNGKARILR